MPCASRSAAAAAATSCALRARSSRSFPASARCSSSEACSRSASESIRASIWVVSCAWRCVIRAISSARLSCSRLRSAVHSATPLLDVALRRGQRLGQLRRRVALALGHVGAPLLGDPPLLLGERRERLRRGRARACARDRRRAARPRARRPRRTPPCRGRSRPRACASSSRARRSATNAAAAAPMRDERGDDRDDGGGGHGSRLGAPPRVRRRSARAAHGQRAQRALQRLRPASVSPSVRRAWRTGVESRRCARLSAVAYAAASTPSTRSDCASTKKPVSAGEAAPGEREPPVGVEAAAEQLEVVGGDEERADGDEDEQAVAPRDRAP